MIDIKIGDCRDVLKTLPDKYFQTCVTSPPYYGLRDYGTATWVGGSENCSHEGASLGNNRNFIDEGGRGSNKASLSTGDCIKCGAKRVDSQIGLEETPEQFVESLVNVFREVKRVLKDDGTLWLNLGDSYSSGSRTSTTNQTVRGNTDYGVTRPPPIVGIKPKDLIGIPWRVAFALQADGWYLRQDIIWHKPNPMPESVQDRCTKAHEYIFLLSKSPYYYYDNVAIKEEAQDWGTRDRTNGKYHNEGTGLNPHTGLEKSYETKNKRSVWTNENSKFEDNLEEKKYRQGMHKLRGEKIVVTRPNLPKKKDFISFLKNRTNVNFLSEHIDVKKTTIEHWFRSDSGFSYPTRDDWIKIFDYVNDDSKEFEDMNNRLTYEEYHLDEVITGDKKNKRSVWTVNTKPYKGAHFAVFPTDLIEPCVLAGSSEKICSGCGKAYRREMVTTDVPDRTVRDHMVGVIPKRDKPTRMNSKNMLSLTKEDKGFVKQCDCDTDKTEQDRVLDPFGGSGTTALVADRHNRDATVIELNESYIEIARNRLEGDSPLFAKVEVS